MTNKDVANSLEEIGLLLELKGENPFKVRAYTNGARIVKGWESGLDELVAEANAGTIKGIGEALAGKIETLVQTGALPYLDELRSEFPGGLLDLFRIPGLGAKKVKVLYEELGVSSIGELEYACNENRLVDLKGFGAKTQANILDGIERVRKFSGRFLMSTARRVADAVVHALEESGHATRVEVAGSVRRRKETVKDVDILATSGDPAALMEAFVGLPDVASVTGHGTTKSSVVFESGIAADLRVLKDEEYAPALLHFTGSKEHNTVLRGIAKKKGYKLSEYGLFEGDKPFPLDTEAAIYEKLGLHFIPPELREDRGEVDAAKEAFPELVTMDDVKGVVHAHTTFSDGSVSLKRLAQAVKDMGYAYLGISDHSQTAAYAGGLKPDDIRRQHDEIDALNEKLAPFRIFKGIESDILNDGSLDYTDKVLSSFDFVIASVHSGFRMPEKEMTGRIVKAVQNPYTRILGHLTGRLLLSREGYPVDVNAVLEAAAEAGVAIEINANPYRLDLDWRYHRKAVEMGIPLAICPDAHAIDGIAHIEYGVGVARKGGLTAKDVLTCRDADEVQSFFQRRRG